jgi:Protein of unknown function (DUF5656)
MLEMQSHRHLPNADRLSIITAMILLSYALASFIKLPSEGLNLQLPAFFFQLPLNIHTLVGVATAALAASGTQWLLSAHPVFATRTSIPHLFIPALTALIIGLPLSTLQASPFWWIVFAFGGVLFVLVLASEYISMDDRDARHAFAGLALTTVSWALFLIVAITVRAAGIRFYLVLFAVFPTVFLVSLRSLHLRLGGAWSYPWALAIAVVITQVALGLHYLPITPLSYGLILLGFAFGLTSLAGSVIAKKPWRTLWIEPVSVFTILLIFAFLFR